MSYKSLLDIFTEQQIELLRRKMWWAADQDRPVLVKFAHDQEFALLQITDLKNLWAARLHTRALLQDKSKYVKSLEIKDSKDLLILFYSLLTSSDKKSLYFFKETQPNSLQFTFQKRIQIFDFTWTFKLYKVTCNSVELACKQLISPLSNVLLAQSKRIQHLKKQFQQVEKDYLRKMTEMERNLYKSPLLEGEEEWEHMLPKPDGKLLYLDLPDKASRFFFSSMLQPQKKVQKDYSRPIYKQANYQPLHRMEERQDFEVTDAILTEQIELQRQRLKKEKKIDFI